MKKMTMILIVSLLALTACSANPRAEIVSASIERDVAQSGGIFVVIEGYRPARVELMVYDFGNVPSSVDANDYQKVTRWLVDHAHFYQNGKELERYFYYHNEKEFVKGKRCKIVVFYQVPDDGMFKGLSFVFDLDGINAAFDGEFAINIE